MVLWLQELRENPRRFDHAESLADLVDADGRGFAPAPAHLRGIAGRGAAGVELHARLDAALSLCCSRCLEPFDWPLGVDVDLALVHQDEAPADPGQELGPEDASTYQAPGGRVELGAIIREQIYLNLPLKPVCVAGCRGLCPSCGSNRNRIECGCRPAAVDPRLEPLERLKNAMAADRARRGRGE